MEENLHLFNPMQRYNYFLYLQIIFKNFLKNFILYLFVRFSPDATE